MSDTEQLLLSSSSDSESEFEKPVKKPKKVRHRKKHHIPVIKKTPRLGFELSIAFIAFWLAIYYFAVVRIVEDLPETIKLQTQHTNHDRFIGERAQQFWVKLVDIGEKVTGSYANEVLAVQLLLGEIKEIENVMNRDLFEIEVDVQQESGAFMAGSMINMYQGIQNVAVKFSSKGFESDSYLMVNTHFDSIVGSPGAGDDGIMVSAAMEVLRVLAINKESFKHPVIFLFNGAEENSYQASHAFITKHKWAKNVKAFINLDSAGSSNREILFRTGPDHPWLLKYYKKYAVHPFCSALIEEVYEAGLVTSGTDFYIFKKFGKIPGLDLAHTFNGYVYHTKYDTMKSITKGTLQNTGDNLLALVKAYSNAPEMEDPNKYATGSNVFFDVFGKYMVLYTAEEGYQANNFVALVALLTVMISVIAIGSNSRASHGEVIGEFLVSFISHVVGVALGAGLAILIAIQLDSNNLTLSWFSNKWMVIGLYFCPIIFGVGLPTAIHISSAQKNKLNLSYRVQLALNAHLVVMAILTAVVNHLNYRSTYLLMMATLFYTVTLTFNTLTTLFRRGLMWVVPVVLVQIIPFMYFTYIAHMLFYTMIPRMAHIGPVANPEFYMAGISLLVATLSLGFVIPLFNLFRQSKTVLSLFVITAAVFVGIAFTPVGFPFRPETSAERFSWMHMQRTFHNQNNSVSSKTDSGFYFTLNDKRGLTTLKDVIDMRNPISVAEDCYDELNCAIPIFNVPRQYALWLPSAHSELPGPAPRLTLEQRILAVNTTTTRFEYKLTGPPHMDIFFSPLKGVKIVEWSFLDDLLKDARKPQPPYFLYFTQGADKSEMKFYIVLERESGSFKEPLLLIAIAGHYMSSEYERSTQALSLKESFPPYTHIWEWESSYESWYF